MFGSYLFDLVESGLICQETAIFVLPKSKHLLSGNVFFSFLLTFIATRNLWSNSIQSSKDFHTYDFTRGIALVASLYGHESRGWIKQGLSVKLHSTSFSLLLYFKQRDTFIRLPHRNTVHIIGLFREFLSVSFGRNFPVLNEVVTFFSY